MKIYRAILTLVLLLTCLSGCKRSAQDFIEDSRSAGRYVGKSFRSLGGKHQESRQVQTLQDMGQLDQEEYIPLHEDDLYQKIVLGDQETLDALHPSQSVPLSKEQPGEVGSAIPPVDQFLSPFDLGLTSVFQHVHFDTNDDIVHDVASLETLDTIANYLREHPRLYTFVEGHCDKRGSRAYNLALGTRRSNSIRVMLIKKGIHPDRIFTISYGKEKPIALGDSSEILQKNRRGEFKLYERKT